jgi:hypothetical protein
MSQKSVHIKASANFAGLSPADLVLLAKNVHSAMPNNVMFTGAPIDAAALGAAIDAYIASAAEAVDSKRAIAEREKQRTVLIHLLRQLAHFVEAACKDDMATFITSGFKPALYTHTAPQPLPAASILKIEQGNTGELLVSPKPLPKARQFEVRYALVGTGGIPTGPWTAAAIPNAKKPAVIRNLTPGTTYTFQVRAYGMLGYTDWSDAILAV